MRHCLVLAFLFECLLSLSIVQADENWSQFRGPGARGISSNTQLPSKWSETENVLWKTPVAGRGWSSPIVWGKQIYVTTVSSEGETQKFRRGLYFGGNRSKVPEAVHEWKVVCLHADTGKVLWQKVAHQGTPKNSLHIKNSYASETPVTDGEHVYAYFGNVGVFCYSMDGQLKWSQPFDVQKTRYDWGTAASPVLHKDRLYIINDNDEASYLVAMNKKTGKEEWRVDRDEKSNWATPYVWENDQRTEIVTPGTGKIRSYDLQGNLLYELGGASSITIATPYSHGGLLYVSSGYVLDLKKPIFAIRPGASGDISLGADEDSNEYIAWRRKKAAPYNPTTLVYGDRMYVLLDRGFFACYDATTGKEVYGRQRLPEGRYFTASPWAYDGKIFCLNEYGKTFVVQAGDEFKLLHVNALADETMCMATPALTADKVILRSDTHVYCLQKK